MSLEDIVRALQLFLLSINYVTNEGSVDVPKRKEKKTKLNLFARVKENYKQVCKQSSNTMRPRVTYYSGLNLLRIIEILTFYPLELTNTVAQSRTALQPYLFLCQLLFSLCFCSFV